MQYGFQGVYLVSYQRYTSLFETFFEKGVAKVCEPMVYSNSGREIHGWQGEENCKDKLRAEKLEKLF